MARVTSRDRMRKAKAARKANRTKTLRACGCSR